MAFPLLAPVLLSTLLTFVLQLILSIGIGLVTYNFALPPFYSYISGFFTDLPTDIFQVLGALRIDQAITMIMSATAARAAVNLVPKKIT